jgi:hypothetical protein
MAHRVALLASLAGGAALLAGSAFAAPRLTDRNSINPAFRYSDDVAVTGHGCGSTGSATVTLPAGATGAKPLAPTAGDSDGGVRVTEVRVEGARITIVAVGEGPDQCDPAAAAEPPATRPWSAGWKLTAEYRRRVQTLIRTNFTTHRPELRLAPRTVFTDKVGSSIYGKVVRLRWTRFGSKRATGAGVYLERPAGFDHGKRVTVTASRARYCRNTGRFEYHLFVVRTGGRLVRGAPVTC